MASLNIKNEETVRLVRELSRRTGQSMTGAITLAVKAQLDQQQANPKAGLAEWLDEITKYTAEVLKDLPPSDKIGDLLYDKETGLPL